MRLERFRLSPAMVVAVVALVLALTGVGWASIPDSTGVVHGCYQREHGQLRVIDTATQSCKRSEVGLSWSQAGPQGPAGSQGPAGPPGPVGSQGATGPAGPGLKSEAATFDSDCNNVDGTMMAAAEQSDGSCVITLPVGGVTGFPLPFVSGATMSGFTNLASNGSGTITVAKPQFNFFFVLVTSSGPNSNTNPGGQAIAEPSSQGSPGSRSANP